MMMRSRPCSAFRRRALARISSTPIDAVSSMKIFARVAALHRVRQLREVALAEEPGAQPVRVDAGLGRQHAQEQLLLRHFEAEEADRHVGLRADVLRDVEHEARLAHRRPRRDDDEVGRLEPGHHLVELDEPGRHAGDELLARVRPARRARSSRSPARASTRSRRGSTPSAIAKIVALRLVDDRLRRRPRPRRRWRGSGWPTGSGCAASTSP